MIQMKKFGVQLLVLLSFIFMSGCGFQLRGATDIDLPALYEKVYLVNKGDSGIAQQLKVALERAGSKIVNSTGSATSVITLSSKGVERRALNIAGREIKEYELNMEVAFVVQDHSGEQLSDAQTVSVIRTYQNDQNNVLGKDNEENTIRKEMNESAVTQILYRLKALAQ